MAARMRGGMSRSLPLPGCGRGAPLVVVRRGGGPDMPPAAGQTGAANSRALPWRPVVRRDEVAWGGTTLHLVLGSQRRVRRDLVEKFLRLASRGPNVLECL